MSIDLYMAFVAASVALILMPGPNVAVIVSLGATGGARLGLIAVAGTSSAMVLQLGATVLGLSGLFTFFAAWFEWLRWLGVFYLAYLGIKAWKTGDAPLSGGSLPADASIRRSFVRGFLVSLTNPKTLLFYGAFLPQFIEPEGDRTRQLLILASTFLAIALCLDSCWALASSRLRPKLGPWRKNLNRVFGGILLSGAAALALARRP